MATVELGSTAQPELAPPPPQPPPKRRAPANTTVAMVVAGLLLFVATYLLLRDREKTYRALVAASDIRPGTIVTADSFTSVDVKLDESVLEGLLTADQAASRDGWVAANSIGAGELVAHTDLRQPAAPSNLRAMSLPVAAENAVAGSLQVGDRVDVIEVVGGVSSYVAADLEVIAGPPPAERRGIEGVSRVEGITVAVEPGEALDLARAISVGELYVVRSTGSTAVEIVPPGPPQPAPPGAAPPDPAAPPPPEDAEADAARADAVPEAPDAGAEVTPAQTGAPATAQGTGG